MPRKSSVTPSPARASTRPEPRTRPRTSGGFQSTVLVLQGGGALGAYQAGVYEALAAAGIAPDWVAGISIGAINSALIAGNRPEDRVARLRAFWEQVSSGHETPWSGLVGDGWPGTLPGGAWMRGLLNQFAAGEVMLRGAPGFFTPRTPPPVLRPPGTAGATSWYETAELRRTLERLVDFDRINHGAPRFSVGAVNVRTGNFTYFDNRTTTIRPEHVMASGALPPAFEAVEIDGEPYWDGGLVSNTPLDWVLNARTELDTLVFQVDLWSARGEAPQDLAEVAVRMKEIQFSSRTRAATDAFRRMQTLRASFNALLDKMPEELRNTPEARLLARASDPAVYNIVQLIYQSATYEGQSKDYEFSRTTMEEHWQAGRRDAERTLAHPEVLTPPARAFAVQTFDFTSAAGHGRSTPLPLDSLT